MRYSKPPTFISEQLTTLKARGLLIVDDERAKRYLKHIGYYRLSAYWMPYEIISNANNNSRNHDFKSNSNFDDIVKFYVFDRKLRVLVMEAIERIEISVRSSWANELANFSNNSHPHLKQEMFTDSVKYKSNIDSLIREVSNSREIFIKHYKRRYTEPDIPPIWSVVETFTFGTLSHWYANTKSNHVKLMVAKFVGIPSSELMKSILHCLTILRNICAHHARLWNRRMTMQLPSIRRFSHDMALGGHNQPKREIYNYFVVMLYMMKSISHKTTWGKG
jgi:abortive infection bacteriophage resistance protein